MKGIRLLFIACLTPLILNTAVADTLKNQTRGTNRRAPTTTTTRNRANTVTIPRTTTTGTNIRERATTPTRGTTARTTTSQKAITVRNTTSQKPRTSTARSAVTTRATPTMTRATNATRLTSRTRSATNTITREDIISRDTKKCREIFYNCMDEFCANKDAQLKRCACSTRINEFRGLQDNLNAVEDKLLDFGQRLLTVNLDKEDAITMNQATEGELAFNQADKSKSKQMLDEIAKKLNTSFDNSNFDQGLNAISLSLNSDAAFDSIDSMAGASTTTKSGKELYSAALPVCREMALEVCSAEELSIAEGGYQMLIEQDCNTVKKSFQTQSDQARTKVFENSALLDMSRLDIHQQRNSDDILTCKNKMLNMLTDSTVCGTDMGKCLDTSGQYIDPSTGAAILTPNLANLNKLITRPVGNQTWTSIPKNSRYISFLNTKKKFLEPAMENCQKVSDYVWDQFIEDALAQIKLAQDAKLEEVRQSCTTLTTQCLDQALDSITDFDARAISVFGISADKTTKAMCADVKNACTALFMSTDQLPTDTEQTDWDSGITEITNTKSYEMIISTCREVGRNCIIQVCTSITGNFGLCENIDKSINRKSIIQRTACWDEVLNCVASAGEKTIDQIMKLQNRVATNNSGTIYNQLYTNTEQIYDYCAERYCTSTETPECQRCRLAEEIWGNCEKEPTTPLDKDTSNKIYLTASNSKSETLLSWFAHNTGTATMDDSCRISECPPGFIMPEGYDACMSMDDITTDGVLCTFNNTNNSRFMVTSDATNCCINGTANNSLINNATTCCPYTSTMNTTNSFQSGNFITTLSSGKICSQTASQSITPILNTTIDNTEFTLACMGGNVATSNVTDTFPGGQDIECDGTYILISNSGLVVDPYTVYGTSTTPSVVSYFYPGIKSRGECTYKCNLTNGCRWYKSDNTECTTPVGWMVRFNTESN